MQESVTVAREDAPKPGREDAREDAPKPGREAAPKAGPTHRGLRRMGLLVAVAAIAVAALGVVERRHNEEAVKQWTDFQAVPEVAVLTPKAGPAVHSLTLPGTVAPGTRRRCTPASAAI